MDDYEPEPGAPPTRKRGLSKRESEFLDRLAVAATVVATPGMSNRARTKKLIELLSGEGAEMSEQQARTWLRKAREYIASGAAAHADDAKLMYVQRLEVYIGEMWQRAIRDKRETTMEPAGPVDPATQKRKLVVTKIKILKDQIDPSLMGLILQAEREKAHVLGVRPSASGRVSIHNQNTTNVQNNVLNTAGSREVSQMSNERLLEMVGAAPASADGGDRAEPILPPRAEPLPVPAQGPDGGAGGAAGPPGGPAA